jgi:hypothetical protein
MTLTQSLLPKLSDWQPAGSGRHSWATVFPDAGWTIRIAADKAESLSCLLWEFTLERTGESPAELTLKTWAEAIAARVSGLSEPLHVYEVDETRGEALLRSTYPARKDEALSYFELRLAGLKSATFRRFAALRKAAGRAQVPFPLTHETLAKLVGDIAG